MIKRKKIYIEALRILAILLVLFQHVPAFDYYLQDTSHVMGHLFFTLIAKINVPLFLNDLRKFVVESRRRIP